MKYILQLTHNNGCPKFLVAVPPTGFKSTYDFKKATRFDSPEAAIKFRAEQGLSNASLQRVYKGGRYRQLILAQ